MRAKCVFALEQTSNAIGFLDQAGSYTYVNRAHATMYGYEPAELIGKSWKIFHTAACIATMDTKVFPLLVKEGGWTGDIIGRQQNGNALTATVSLALFPAQAQSNDGLLWICHDPRPPRTSAGLPAPPPASQPIADPFKPPQASPYGSCSWKIWKTIASWFPSY